MLLFSVYSYSITLYFIATSLWHFISAIYLGNGKMIQHKLRKLGYKVFVGTVFMKLGSDLNKFSHVLRVFHIDQKQTSHLHRSGCGGSFLYKFLSECNETVNHGKIGSFKWIL